VNPALADALKCPETPYADPRHAQVIALRIGGKRWSEIAAELGITYRTLCRWREEYPEIEQAIYAEALDFLASSKLRLAQLQPLADQAIQEGLAATKTIVMGEAGAAVVPDFMARLAAAKMVKAPFEKSPADKPRVQVTVNAHERGALPASGRAGVVDAEPDLDELERRAIRARAEARPR
jgi:hypothetical protein